MKRAILILWCRLVIASSHCLAQDDLAFFEKRVRPVFEEHCYGCHSARSDKIKGGLRLDSKAGWQRGGDSGHAAIVPSRTDASPLIAAVEWRDEDTRMPPKKKLPQTAIDDLTLWVRLGAPDPRVEDTTAGRSAIDIEEGKKHWAFRPVRHVEPPRVKSDWPRNDIDRFVFAKLEDRTLHPAADAGADELHRRISFDLIGLPSAADELSAFQSEIRNTQSAIPALVDRLLESPRFGEKWGRHWLDVARYSESSGRNVNFLYAEAWRYRDYVIAAFNGDKPYDQFIKEQIAGDLLPYRDVRDQAAMITATGFLAIGPKSHDEAEREKFLSDVADEQIDAVTQAMLGLTVACARCHDHKHDPVSQRDYYALAGIFLSSEPLFGTCYQLQNWNFSSLIEMPVAARLPSPRKPLSPADIAALDRKVIETKRAEVAASFNRQSDRYTARFTREEASFARAERDLYEANGQPRILLMGVLDRKSPTDARLLRGEINQPADVVPRGFVSVLSDKPLSIRKGSGRLELAELIASRGNPLTARVMVNRVWAKLFGRGLVATTDDFGKMGARPSHPELLDYLAGWFMEHGWSVKKLIREIMLSRTYQMSTKFDPACDEVDPDNHFLWRMSRRRLDAEAVRDAMLAVSGQLIEEPPVGSPVALLRESRTGPDDLQKAIRNSPHLHRAVYLPIVRGQSPHALGAFDFADPSMVCGQRATTNVPAQSLFLLNDDFVQSQADVFAARLAKTGGTVEEQAVRGFTHAFSRKPERDEQEAIRDFLSSFVAISAKTDAQAVLSAYCQSLFVSGEFRHLN